jgi:hypothetical protein
MYNVSLFLEYWKPFFLKEFFAKLCQVKIQRRCFSLLFLLSFVVVIFKSSTHFCLTEPSSKDIFLPVAYLLKFC